MKTLFVAMLLAGMGFGLASCYYAVPACQPRMVVLEARPVVPVAGPFWRHPCRQPCYAPTHLPYVQRNMVYNPVLHPESCCWPR